jgi:hypothetical protein
MSDEAIVYRTALRIPYSWAAGKHATRFYKELAENRKIYGTRCPGCQRVLVPARKTCSRCFTDTTEWVEVKKIGVVKSFTIAHYAEPSIQPTSPPFPYALIQLDGADTAFIHLLAEVDLKQIKTGMRVEAVFAEAPQGNILDIQYFKPAPPHGSSDGS